MKAQTSFLQFVSNTVRIVRYIFRAGGKTAYPEPVHANVVLSPNKKRITIPMLFSRNHQFTIKIL